MTRQDHLVLARGTCLLAFGTRVQLMGQQLVVRHVLLQVVQFFCRSLTRRYLAVGTEYWSLATFVVTMSGPGRANGETRTGTTLASALGFQTLNLLGQEGIHRRHLLQIAGTARTGTLFDM